MKRIFTNTFMVILIAATITTSCKEEPRENPLEGAKKLLLASDWILSSATLDETDYTDLYDGLNLKFNSDGTYDVTNAMEPVWNPSGTYEMISVTALELDGVRSVVVEELTSDALTLKFHFDGSGGRTSSSVDGEYVFEFTAQ